MKKNYWATIWLLALIAMVSSCASVNPYLSHYKSAQEAFNEASSTENSMLSNPNVAFSLAPETGYRTARSFAIKAMGTDDKDNRSALAADGLLLGIYTIKSMSEWKLGLYQEAISTTKNCQITFEKDASVQQQRDFIIMQVMEPLIYNDSIATYIAKVDKNASLQVVPANEMEYMKILEKGFRIVEEKRLQLPAGHALNNYLLIAQLSIAKNWKNLYSSQLLRLRRGRSEAYESWKDEGDAEKDQMNNRLAAVFEQLADAIGNTHALYMQWKKAHADVAGI